jgi:hypothetical protein
LDAPSDAQKTSSTRGRFPCQKQFHPDEHDAGIFPALSLSLAASIAVHNRNDIFVHRKMNRKTQLRTHRFICFEKCSKSKPQYAVV